MKLTVKSNAAVSPVIGTILLVAITVVLVAIIAAVVMGMAGSTGNNKDVGLTIDTAEYVVGGNINVWYPAVQVILYGGKDVNDLVDLNVSIEGADFTIYLDPGYVTREGDISNPSQEILSNPVGFPLYYTPYPSVNESTKYVNVLVTVTGTFTDGTQQVLLTRTLTLPTEKQHGNYLTDTDNYWNGAKEIIEGGYYPSSPKFR